MFNTTPETQIHTYLTKQQKQQFKQLWKKVTSSNKKHTLKGYHYMLYNILVGKPMLNGFTCRTNEHKIRHQRYINPGAYNACASLSTTNEWRKQQIIDNLFDKFVGLDQIVSREEIDKICNNIPKIALIYNLDKQADMLDPKWWEVIV